MYGRSWFVIGFFLIAISESSPIDSRGSSHVSTTFKRPGKIIIDTDGGGDDAAALFLALAAEKQMKNDDFKIIAITCSYGNTEETQVEQNILKILTIANRTDIPVYAGVHNPLLKAHKMDNFFGRDGLGDVDFDVEVMGKIDRSKHATVALVDLAREHSGKLSVMALGPLTNIAIAIALDPNFVDNVEQFYIMGSSVRGLGNVAAGVEFNFYQDPHSNSIVFKHMRGPPAILLPWESAVGAQITTEWRKNVLGAVDSRAVKFLNQVERKNFLARMWEVADLMLMALTLWPELITKSLLTNLTPVFDGSAQGSVLVDYTNRSGNPNNVIIIEAFDVEGFKQTLLDVFA